LWAPFLVGDAVDRTDLGVVDPGVAFVVVTKGKIHGELERDLTPLLKEFRESSLVIVAGCCVTIFLEVIVIFELVTGGFCLR
jgi:hypothetical protein